MDWIRGTFSWALCSPDLSSMYFFLRGTLKNSVLYAAPVDSEMGLESSIVCAPADIEENPDVFERVR